MHLFITFLILVQACLKCVFLRSCYKTETSAILTGPPTSGGTTLLERLTVKVVFTRVIAEHGL